MSDKRTKLRSNIPHLHIVRRAIKYCIFIDGAVTCLLCCNVTYITIYQLNGARDVLVDY